jgi:hypothetical protein
VHIYAVVYSLSFDLDVNMRGHVKSWHVGPHARLQNVDSITVSVRLLLERTKLDADDADAGAWINIPFPLKRDGKKISKPNRTVFISLAIRWKSSSENQSSQHIGPLLSA